jgi:3-hydroxyisobutyrate dehydrogenase
MKRIGFVGLGTMGHHMAMNILKAGYDLCVYNRTPEKAKALVEAGAAQYSTAREVGAKAELVVTCVSDAPDVEEVILGVEGVAKGMSSGGIIVDCSTSSPALAREMELELEEDGIGILDAPVSGGPEGAKQGTLAIMCGGREEVFRKAEPVLQSMGKSITHVGPAGAGQLTKAINQIIVAINMEAVAEGIVLARKSGIDPEKVLRAISGGAARSWILENRGPLMLREEFTPPRFALRLHAKDLHLALEAAHSAGANLDFAQHITQIVDTLLDLGHGDKDHSGIYLYSRKKNEV